MDHIYVGGNAITCIQLSVHLFPVYLASLNDHRS